MSAVDSSLALYAVAHGKIILGGEHAVLYGCPALATAIPEGLELRCEITSAKQPLILDIPHWGLYREYCDTQAEPSDPVHAAVEAIFRGAGRAIQGAHIRGKTTLPAGSGLGSSAALCVALAKLALGEEANEQAIFDLSMAGESVFHGQASGIDSELALRGGMLRFVKGQAPERLSLPTKLDIWVIDSQHPRKSAEQVQRVAARMQRFPELSSATWALFEAQVGAMQSALLAGDAARLGALMDQQHQQLRALGVSTPRLDEICQMARRAGALGAKLTGAGGGGCALAILDPAQSHEEFARALEACMQEAHGECFPHFPVELSAA